MSLLLINSGGALDLTNVPICDETPTKPNQLTNKQYVDSKSGGLISTLRLNNYLNSMDNLGNLNIDLSSNTFNYFINNVDINSYEPMGVGFDNAVNAIVRDLSGNIYAGGIFTNTDGLSVNRVAKWSGSSWSSLGSGPTISGSTASPAVNAFIVDNSNNLYVGGSMSSGGNIQLWNRSSWANVDFSGTQICSSLAKDNSGNIYASTSTPFSTNKVYKYSNSIWTTLTTTTTNAIINAIYYDSFRGRLYAGGNFTGLTGSSTSQRIAYYDGFTWLNLGINGGANGAVNIILGDSLGNIYIGGLFTAVGLNSTFEIPANYIAKYDGSSFYALGGGLNGAVNALAFDTNGNLIVGGNFSYAGGIRVNGIAKWDGTTWSSMGSGLNNAINSICSDNSGNLYVGGSFITQGSSITNLPPEGSTSLQFVSKITKGLRNVYSVNLSVNNKFLYNLPKNKILSVNVDSSGNPYANNVSI